MATKESAGQVELQLSEELRPLLSRVYQMVRRRSPGWDISAVQSSVLTALLDKGPLRMGELAALEGVRMPTATSMVSRLEKLGLVRRMPDSEDRRAVLVDLTDDGRSQIAELVAERNDQFADLLAGLDEADLRHLRDAVPAMARLLALDAATPLRTGES